MECPCECGIEPPVSINHGVSISSNSSRNCTSRGGTSGVVVLVVVIVIVLVVVSVTLIYTEHRHQLE